MKNETCEWKKLKSGAKKQMRHPGTSVGEIWRSNHF
jgi:hypothetical protein